VAGSDALVAKLNGIIKDVISRPRDAMPLVDDVEAMRQRLFEHQQVRGPLDIKNGPGGLIDIEFAAQTLILGHAAHCPEILGADRAAGRGLLPTLETLRDAGLMVRADYDLFYEAAGYYAALRQISGLCLEPESDVAGRGAIEMVLNAVHAPDPARLQAQLTQLREDVSRAVSRVLHAQRDRATH